MLSRNYQVHNQPEEIREPMEVKLSISFKGYLMIVAALVMKDLLVDRSTFSMNRKAHD